MLRIPIVRPNEFSFERRILEIDNQDQTISGVFKKGPVVSKLDGQLQAEVYHMTDSLGHCLLFRMSLLEFSKCAEAWPSFSEEGLLGWWKILRNDDPDRAGIPPEIQLQEAVMVDNLESFKQVVMHSSSASFVRQIQAQLLADHEESSLGPVSDAS